MNKVDSCCILISHFLKLTFDDALAAIYSNEFTVQSQTCLVPPALDVCGFKVRLIAQIVMESVLECVSFHCLFCASVPRLMEPFASRMKKSFKGVF